MDEVQVRRAVAGRSKGIFALSLSGIFPRLYTTTMDWFKNIKELRKFEWQWRNRKNRLMCRTYINGTRSLPTSTAVQKGV
jgi:hypothetical protein